MIRKVFLTTVGLFLSVTAAQAGSLQIGINDYSVEGAVIQQVIDDRQGTTEICARGLYNSRSSSALGEIGLDALGTLGDLQGLKAGIGIRLIGGDADDEEIAAVALGVHLRINPPELNGIGLRGQFFYSPKILTYKDGDRLLASAVELEYEFMPRARIFLGYGYTKVNTEEHGDIRVDDSIRVGASFGF